MPSFYWIKLYHEILNDPKMGRLSDRLWRRCIECFLMAGQQADDGYLPCTADMAWMLRTDEATLVADLTALAEYNILEERDGRWYVINFTKRQDADTPAEKQARYRERKRKQEYYAVDTPEQLTCYEHVTIGNTDKSRVDIDKSRVDTRDFPNLDEFTGDPPQQAATPPEPAARRQRTKTPKEPPPPAVQVYRDITRRWPPKALWQQIDADVGDNVKRWSDVVLAYISHGWNPSNVANMLDFLKRGEVPGTKGKNDASTRRHDTRRSSWAQPDGHTAEDIDRILAERAAEDAASG